MNFTETTDYLFSQYPVFTKEGATAYKPGLDNILKICSLLGHPQHKFKSIHIAGTNGKGSTSHFLATIFQLNGYKTGLYTSPHLYSFTERIRINGKPISENEVIDFVMTYKSDIEQIKPSFFEITTAMAFDYFAKNNIDIAIIETGLGGRLDSTNVIQPIVSIITNIGWDHTDLLGDTLEKIAYEKAGIIKKNTPVVISEYQKEVEHVFLEKSKLENASLIYSEEFKIEFLQTQNSIQLVDIYKNNKILYSNIEIGLGGIYQSKNLKGVLKSCEIINLLPLNFNLDNSKIIKALLEVKNDNNLNARWQTISYKPLLILDTAHNIHGFESIVEQIKTIKYNQLWIILGMVADKNHELIFEILPKSAFYIFAEPTTKRKMPVEQLSDLAKKHQLKHISIKNVNEALKYAKNQATEDDFILVCGSNYLIGELIIDY